jgi:hypothetical protein
MNHKSNDDLFAMALRIVVPAPMMAPSCRSAHVELMLAPGSFEWGPALAPPAYPHRPMGVLTLGSPYPTNPNPVNVHPAWCPFVPNVLWCLARQPSQVSASFLRIPHSLACPLHGLQVLEALHEFSEHASGMPPQLERSMQSLNAQCAQILQTLLHGEVINKGGDAQEALRVLQHVHEALDVKMAFAGLLWTWQDLFKVWQRVALIVIIIHDYCM